MANPETLLGEIEAKTRELIGGAPRAQTLVFCLVCFPSHRASLFSLTTAKRTTPLLEYIKNKKIEKQV